MQLPNQQRKKGMWIPATGVLQVLAKIEGGNQTKLNTRSHILVSCMHDIVEIRVNSG